MRKLLLVFMALILVMSLAACGGGADGTTTAAPTTTEGTTTELPVTTTEVTTTAASATTTEATITAAPVTTTETTTTEQVEGLNLENFKVALSIKKPAAKVPASTYDVWDGSIATAFAGGDGTKENPYLISNGAELAYLSYLVYSIEKIPNPAAADGSLMLAPNPTRHVYYKLTKDIYLNDVSNVAAWSADPYNVPNGVNVWTPIGVAAGDTSDNTERRFQGYFDGAGFTVYGIYNTPMAANGGLFGIIYGDPTEEGSMPFAGLTGLEEIGLEGVMEYAYVRDVTVSHSFITGIGHTGAIVGRATNCAILNCIIDESVSICHYGTNGSNVGTIAGIVGRGDLIWMRNCINSATLRSVIEPKVGSDGAISWGYCGYVAGVASIFAGFAEECASFGDIYAAYEAGLLCGFVGNSKGPGVFSDCYAEGTIYDAWKSVDTSTMDRKNLNHVGPLVGQACRQDSHLNYTVIRCVSAGKFADDVEFEYFNKVGTVAGLHKEWSAVMQILWVNYGYPEDLPLCADWDTKASLIWMDIYEATPEQLSEYRAQYAQ